MSWPERRGVGAVLAVARDRAVDEARVLLLQPLVAHAQPVEHAGAERLEQDVVFAGQPEQDLAPFSFFRSSRIERLPRLRARKSADLADSSAPS